MEYNDNQIKEVAKKIAKDIPYTSEYICKILGKYSDRIRIGINLYNIDNDSITWGNYYNDEYIIMFDSDELQGININRNEYLNDYECCLMLNC